MKKTPEILALLTAWNIFHYELVDDGLIINQPLDWRNKNLTTLPFPILIVDGDVDLSGNQLSDFTNFPTVIYGSLNISHNQFNTLVGCPMVSGDFDASYNNLINIEGIGRYIGNRTLNVSHNYLIDVDGINVDFEGLLDVSANYLTDLTEKLWIKDMWFKDNALLEENLDRHYARMLRHYPDLIPTYLKKLSPAAREEFAWYGEGHEMGFLCK